MLLQNKFLLLGIVVFNFINIAIAEDLISSKSGGKAIHWTSEKYPFIAQNIIDDREQTYWVSSGNILPHVLTFSLPSNKRFESLSFTAKNNNKPETWAKHIRISSADPFPHMGGWEVIADLNLPKTGVEKIITIEPKRGRYFRLEIFTTQSEAAKEASFGKFKVLDTFNK